jgi:proteasome lid subunit RPN8/RPN11
LRIAPDLLEEIVEHARRDAPAECCGVVISRDGVAESVHPLANLARTPKMGFEVDPMVLSRLLDEAEDDGAEIGAIYHSHPRSAPEPSQTDINFSAGWPGVEWIIVGHATTEPTVRSWLIADGQPAEVELTP